MAHFFFRYSFLLPALLFVSTLPSTAQPVVIFGTVSSDTRNSVRIDQLGVRVSGEANKRYHFPVSHDSTFAFTINDIDEGMYKIGDGFIGHRIYIAPGDSIKIHFQKKAKRSYEIFYDMIVESRYVMHYMFFDSCLSFFGHNKPIKSKEEFRPDVYKEQCQSAFKKAKDFLDSLHKQKQVSDSFYKYAGIELGINYLDWLIFPFAKYRLDPKSVEPAYFSELAEYKFDDVNALEKTGAYLRVAELFNNFGLNTIDEFFPEEGLIAAFYSAADHFTGPVKDILMVRRLDELIRASVDNDVIDKAIEFFSKECETPEVRHVGLPKFEAWRLKMSDAPAMFRKLMDEHIFSDLQGETFSINSLPVKSRWLVIDCWASWCKPCKEQDPYFEEFRQKYKERIAFLKFSVDADRMAWKNDIEKFKKDPTINYLVTGGTDNSFSYFFELNTIPRFILIDMEKKEVIDKNLPFPKEKERFEAVLLGHVSNK